MLQECCPGDARIIISAPKWPKAPARTTFIINSFRPHASQPAASLFHTTSLLPHYSVVITPTPAIPANQPLYFYIYLLLSMPFWAWFYFFGGIPATYFSPTISWCGHATYFSKKARKAERGWEKKKMEWVG